MYDEKLPWYLGRWFIYAPFWLGGLFIGVGIGAAL